MATNSEFLLPSQVPEFARVIIECWKILIAILITVLLHQKDNNQDQPKEETQRVRPGRTAKQCSC